VTRFTFVIHGTINLPGPNSEYKGAKSCLEEIIVRARELANQNIIEDIRIYTVES